MGKKIIFSLLGTFVLFVSSANAGILLNYFKEKVEQYQEFKEDVQEQLQERQEQRAENMAKLLRLLLTGLMR